MSKKKLLGMVKKRVGPLKRLNLKVHKSLSKPDPDFNFERVRSVLAKKTKGKSKGEIFSTVHETVKSKTDSFVVGTGTEKSIRKQGVGFELLRSVIKKGKRVKGNLVSDSGKGLRDKFHSDFKFHTEKVVKVRSTAGKKRIKTRLVKTKKGNGTKVKVTKDLKGKKNIRRVRIRGRFVTIRRKGK